jgi:hypothetical protein
LKTISNQYLDLQKKLHENDNYGVASLAFAPLVAGIINNNNIRTVSDYGAGKKRLEAGLTQNGIKLEHYFPYDPVFPEYGPPKAADLVCCIDVLEHVEDDHLSSVLEELQFITERYGFFSVHTGPAGKFLEDGRNAHLIQQPASWWLPKICMYFEVLHLQTHQLMGQGFWLIVSKLK